MLKPVGSCGISNAQDTARFWSVFDELPESIQTLARKNFELLKQTLPTLLPVFQAGGEFVVSAGRYPLPRLGGSARMGLLGCGSGIMPFMTGLSGSVSGISKFFYPLKSTT